MSDIPDRFTAGWYEEEYFTGRKGGKKFCRPNGSIETWSYANKEGEFLGAGPIAKAWKTMFNPRNMLSVGEGRGTFVAYARDEGIEAVGFDYSKFAVSDEGRYKRCKREWLIQHDAAKPWPYPNESFDLVIALDFCEHVYESDIDFIIGEFTRVTKKWLFLQIATAGSGGLQGEQEFKGYSLKKNEKVPVELEGCAVAGHVNVRSQEYWYDKFDFNDWMPRRDMREWFTGLVDPAIIKNWLLNTIMVLAKVEQDKNDLP